MASFFFRAASRTSVPVAAALASQSTWLASRCDADAHVRRSDDATQQNSPEFHHNEADHHQQEGMRPEEKGEFHHLFPKRQLWHPKVPYPLWDRNWDGREPPSTGDKEKDRELMRYIRKTGVTRHIILIRHGQYDENSKGDEHRKLTPLGKVQAELTGKRLAEMIHGAQDAFGPCRIRVLRVSGMTRAKETADIIASYLPSVEYVEPDPELNEGRPCHNIPGAKASPKVIELTDDNHPRIEMAFQKYFFRSWLPDSPDPVVGSSTSSKDAENEEDKHEFEIIVCHANVIRYFLCRALQLPPEVWLRYCPFNCSLTYITIRPTGSVSCRMLGDIGHLPYSASTFSKHHGFNW